MSTNKYKPYISVYNKSMIILIQISPSTTGGGSTLIKSLYKYLYTSDKVYIIIIVYVYDIS